MARLATNPQIHADSVEELSSFKPVKVDFFLLLLVLYLTVLPHNSGAQTKIKPSAKRHYDTANSVVAFDPDQALTLFKESIRIDSTFAAAYIRVGQILLRNELTQKESIKYYVNALRLDSNQVAFLPAYEIVGLYFLQQGNYEKANQYFHGITRLEVNRSNKIYKSAARYLSQCKFALNYLKKRTNIAFLHQPLPEPLNTSFSQSYPVLTADLQTIIFTRNNLDENLYTSSYTENGWSKPQSLSREINTDFNEGTCTISTDGRTLIFAACKRRENYGKCDLYSSKKIGNAWQKPQNLGPLINSTSWQSQPSLSADGRTLFFSSDRRGGIGGKDIWKSHLDSLSWCMPINLGEEINTEFDEVSPFIHANNISLFFASDGRPGMGGLDIFLSKNNTNHWSLPLNLGMPLNDYANQVGFAIAPDCQRAFYSYNDRSIDQHKQGSKITVLCDYALPDSLQALCPAVIVIKGAATNAFTKKPLGVKLLVNTHEETYSPMTFIADDSTGFFLLVLPSHLRSTVLIEEDGYYPKILEIDTDLLRTRKDNLWNIELQPIEFLKSEILKSVTFEYNSSALDTNSYDELRRLASYLLSHPSLRLLIEGHTDEVGNEQNNIRLSIQRAEAVIEYLSKLGVTSERLEAKGYGKTRPLITGDTAELRKKNRRVEWRILK